MNTNLILLSQTGFAILTVVFLYFLMKTLRFGIERTSWSAVSRTRVFNLILGTILIWFLFVAIWSASGAMGRFENFPFNFAPVLIVPLATIVLLVIFSKGLREILEQIPPSQIIVLQNFRVFVEILLWMLFVASMLPEHMTFEGRNFDILAGLTAPLVSWALSRNKISRTVAIVWNIACLGLLINIVTIAFLSTPSPIRVFMEEPSSAVVALFPISFLPGFLVPLAYTLHFFSLRQLLASEKVKQPVLN
ncbi:MAG TPA: hypothetical protein VGD40_21465 [Chryseosolibacter sp.]